MFQITDDEFNRLRSQIVTSNQRDGRRYLPYAFTEQEKRNIKRFPSYLMFQLSAEEYNLLKTQNATLEKWEEIYNPDFNSPEFEGIKNQAGLNRFVLSVKQWVTKTNSKGIIAKAGRYGGTYAHKDIAFEFASWISPQFKLYLIKEFERLKDEEQKQLGWDIRRNLAKINYHIHTDAIKENLIPATQ